MLCAMEQKRATGKVFTNLYIKKINFKQFKVIFLFFY